ncbi:hypothetical protein [Sulfitobacter dubius]|uniref:hypothetical protein n=1 Tax=Sulfitobacter dubius TaxID=218673 RepID=UPI0022AFD795|nr:hypothetical protein [Sulfitobacter dubius]MCZ4367046.1 hypothetical protein [Sulfitobacter dubius]
MKLHAKDIEESHVAMARAVLKNAELSPAFQFLDFYVEKFIRRGADYFERGDGEPFSLYEARERAKEVIRMQGVA